MKSIDSVVAMVPMREGDAGLGWFFVVEKLGLEIAEMGGVEEEMAEDE